MHLAQLSQLRAISVPSFTKADEGARAQLAMWGSSSHGPWMKASGTVARVASVGFVAVKHWKPDDANVVMAPCDLSNPVGLKHQAVPAFSDARIPSMMLGETQEFWVTRSHCDGTAIESVHLHRLTKARSW